jgi:hypothetical protein
MTVEIDQALTGPYDPDNGVCANGHPVNSKGRCEPLNETGTCMPPQDPQ